MSKEKSFWNPEMETLPPDEYRSVQETALLRQLDYVWNYSVFYREKFLGAGLAPGEIRSLSDLAKLPFTKKQELRDSQMTARPLGKHAACAMDKVIRVYSTSGTTGVPTYIGLTAHDREIWRETAMRAMWTCSMRPSHIVPLPIGTFFIAASYGEAIERLGATLVPVGVGATDRLVAAINNLGANFILATTSFPLYLLDYCKQKSIDARRLGIMGFMLGGEPGAGTPPIRQRIEEGFGATVRETMGNGDILGLMWADCGRCDGMHFIGQGVCHPEIIDPENGDVLAVESGVKGELVYTSLDRECQPLIRFRTRDHVEVTQTECDCGRTGFCITCIGRTDDMLIVSGVNVYPSAIRDVVGTLVPRVTGEIQIQLGNPPPMVAPPLTIKVETGLQEQEASRLKEKIEKLLREKLIFRAAVDLVPVGSLPKFEYKACLVQRSYES